MGKGQHVYVLSLFISLMLVLKTHFDQYSLRTALAIGGHQLKVDYTQASEKQCNLALVKTMTKTETHNT